MNLNTATEKMLLRLGGADEPLVHCLLDYRDTDSDPHPQGLEQDPTGDGADYLVKNAPFGTPEELLLVKGFTGAIVFGEDANRNGTLEPNEDDGDESFPPDDRDGQLDAGLGPRVTTFSYDLDVDSEGNPRIDINKTDPATLAGLLQDAGLPKATAEFVAEARKAGTKFTDPSQLLGMELEIDDPNSRGRKKTIRSEVDKDSLHVVMDKLSVGGGQRDGRTVLPGRINLNTAPAAVLAAVGALSENTARWIIDHRATLDDERRATTAWPYTEGGVDADTFKSIAPYLTARSYQFRVRSFGYSMVHGSFCVLEAVIDTASGRPRIVYLRDLTRLGLPMPVTVVER